jgi:hypothetical protein
MRCGSRRRGRWRRRRGQKRTAGNLHISRSHPEPLRQACPCDLFGLFRLDQLNPRERQLRL